MVPKPVVTCLIKDISNKPGLHRGIPVDELLPRPPFLRTYPKLLTCLDKAKGEASVQQQAAGLCLKARVSKKHPKLFDLLNPLSAPPQWELLWVGLVFCLFF